MSFERPQPGADPADPRGALLHTPKPAPPAAALPAQARTGETPSTPGTATPCGKGKEPASPPSDNTGPEHSQPAAVESGTHRPRPVPEAVPDQPGAEQQGRAPDSDGQERRIGQKAPSGRPTPMRRDGDRLRFVGAATRRIARGIDLDEIVMGLCRATVPTFSDAILVYLRDPLPVGDERPTGPLVLRLRRSDRIPQQERDLEDGILPVPVPENPTELDALGSELCEVQPGSALAEVLRGVRPV